MKTVILLLVAMMAQAQSFEVATVKPCSIGQGRGSAGPSPGRLNVGCVPVRDLIHTAYSVFADGVGMNPNGPQIQGGPGWIDSEFYEVNAKAGGNPPPARMAGPMLQLLLEDRFNLKIHRETRELPVFFLTVAKSGLKMQRAKEGSCDSFDINHPPPSPAPGQPRPNPCGPRRMRGSGPTTIGLGGRGMTVTEIFGTIIGNMVGRPVIDKTGLTGQYDFTIEWMPGGADAPADAAGPSIFTAIQEQLGLKLESAKGPVDVIGIDHVDRPSAN